MIKPLVQEANHPVKWLSVLGVYTLGSASSSILLGSLLGALGSLFIQNSLSWRLLFVPAVLGLLMALSDFSVGGLKTCTLRRQTDRRWWDLLGPVGAVFLWGFDLGLGLTTVRVASLYWVVAFVVIVVASPLMGALILGFYGLAIALNLVLGLLLFHEGKRNVAAAIQAIKLLQPIKTCLAVLLLIWSVWLIILSVRG
jgi:hypothetical protein